MYLVPAIMVGVMRRERDGRSFNGCFAVHPLELTADHTGVDFPQALADQFGRCAAQHGLRLAVHISEFPVDIEAEECIGDAVQDGCSIVQSGLSVFSVPIQRCAFLQYRYPVPQCKVV
jgi:hypothetical protein